MKLGLMTRRTGLVPPFKGLDAGAQDLIAPGIFGTRPPLAGIAGGSIVSAREIRRLFRKVKDARFGSSP